MATKLSPEPYVPEEPQLRAVTFVILQDNIYFPAHRDKEVDEAGTLVAAREIDTAGEFEHYLNNNAACAPQITKIECPRQDFEVTMCCTQQYDMEGLRQDLIDAIHVWNVERRKLEEEVLEWHRVYVMNTFSLSADFEDEMI